MNIAIVILLAIVGAGLGSFACCQAWRIRKGDKSVRSHCMNCSYQLKWYDNIPIVSWLMLGGKCRKCHKKIGLAELIAELALAAIFALSYVIWPQAERLAEGDSFAIARFVVFLVQLVLFMILAVYDAKWKEMPTAILIASCAVGLVYWGLMLVELIMLDAFSVNVILNVIGAIVILPGFYYFMYKASKERWVGSGDAILCIPLALMLGNFWLAMFCLFAANMIGSIIMLPVTTVKHEKHAMIPFGPFLIVGFLVIFFLQNMVINFVSF